jgi:hypothetical protein
MTFLTSLIGLFSGNPLCMRALKFGGVPDLGNPYRILGQVTAIPASMSTYQWILMLQCP